jgi:hypothetical protein
MNFSGWRFPVTLPWAAGDRLQARNSDETRSDEDAKEFIGWLMRFTADFSLWWRA